jgi:putative membrane protein (TIGR04086 family)
MKKCFIYFRSILYFYLILLGFTIFVTLFNYFNIIDYKTLTIISFVFVILLFMMSGFFIAKYSNRNGYVNGLIIGAANIILLLILSLILGETPRLSIGIYFLILLLSSTIGGMFGINFSRKS